MKPRAKYELRRKHNNSSKTIIVIIIEIESREEEGMAIMAAAANAERSSRGRCDSRDCSGSEIRRRDVISVEKLNYKSLAAVVDRTNKTDDDGKMAISNSKERRGRCDEIQSGGGRSNFHTSTLSQHRRHC